MAFYEVSLKEGEKMKELLNKPFLNNKDISKLLECSPSKASRIRQQIATRLEAQGKTLLTNDIPTKLFVEIMCLDVDALRGA